MIKSRKIYETKDIFQRVILEIIKTHINIPLEKWAKDTKNLPKKCQLTYLILAYT